MCEAEIITPATNSPRRVRYATPGVVITPAYRTRTPCLANPRVNGASLPQITVTATAAYADLGMLSFLDVDPITLTVSHQELKVS